MSLHTKILAVSFLCIALFALAPNGSQAEWFDTLAGRAFANNSFVKDPILDNNIQELNREASDYIKSHSTAFDPIMSAQSDSSREYLASAPEPETMLILGVGLLGLATVGRKKFIK